MSKNSPKALDVSYDIIIIIDCLPEDEYIKYEISQDLKSFFNIEKFPNKIFRCKSKKELISSLVSCVQYVHSKNKNIIIHFISHGNKSGIGIKSTKELIEWDEFRQLLRNINTKMNGNLVINITSCFGLNAIKINNEADETPAFFGLIGYSKRLKASKGKEINRLFYGKMLEGKQVNVSVEEVKLETSDGNLYCMSSRGYKKIKKIAKKKQ